MKNKIKISNLLQLIIIFLGICNIATGAPNNIEKAATSSTTGAAASNQHITLENYRLIQEIINLNTPKQNHVTESLELKLKIQEKKIRTLEKEIAKLNKPDDTSIQSIILASVSVIVTVLGVLIALLSIFGYTNIKNESVKSSKETAKATIAEIAGIGLQEATETSLIKLIKEGRFDEIIKNAIANIEYRGISIPDGLPDEEKQL